MTSYDRIVSDESETWSYGKFVESLWAASEYADGVVVACAGLEDSSKLRKLIEKAAILSDDHWYTFLVDQHHDIKFVSPLLRAIERQRPENVSLLLEQDVNPDGVRYDRKIAYARRYRRFCFEDYVILEDWEVDVEKEAVGTPASQTEPPYLTDDELVERRTTMTQFWTSPYRMIIDHSDDVAQWHSVVKAGTSTPEIFDLLLDAGADITAWCEPTDSPLPEEEEELLPSHLCISTPIHAAIASENHDMLRKLFNSGIGPNARALMAGNQALTPAQYAIMLGDLETYTLLRDNGADPSITTPVLNTHALHFAVAQLRIDLMEAIMQDLSGAAAPVTTMGHTLLHIACLPFNRGHIQTSSGKISKSIHDIRYMSPVFRRASRTIPTYNDSGEENFFCEPATAYQTQERQRRLANFKNYPSSMWQWSRDPRKDHAKQEAVCKYILATYNEGPKVSDADKHGNNMLHYLAAARYPNTPLIDWARQKESDERAWSSERNFCGHTAEDLYEEANDARSSSRDAAYLEALHPSDREYVLKG